MSFPMPSFTAFYVICELIFKFVSYMTVFAVNCILVEYSLCLFVYFFLYVCLVIDFFIVIFFTLLLCCH